MNYLDLFSGIGGFALGAYWAGIGFDEHYFSEIEKYAMEVYQKRFPAAKTLGDIRNVDYARLPAGEWIVTGGFPCQPHSVAGKKHASKDERDLWPECRRMLRELRPRAALFENVPGLFNSDGGRFFNGILSDIHRCGYDAEWQIISASEIGAPHIRKRVWIICYPNNAGGGQPHYWRTPDANMERGNRSYENMKMRIEEGKPLNLNDQLNAIEKGLLPIPIVGTPTASMKKRSNKFITKILNPVEYVQMFPTPRANSGTDACIHGKGGKDLQSTVKMLPTPTVQDYKHRDPKSNQQGLADIVRLWPTPIASDADKNSRNREEHLSGAVHHWATPTANDAKNSITDSQVGRGTLTAHIVEREGDHRGQLNPDWVEALMGYPLYWTDISKDEVVAMDLPSAWLDGTWEAGIPRVITGQKNRIKRLKGLGNAVVPQIPMILWLLIKEYL